MKNEEIPIFPVTELTVGPVPRMGLIMIRPDYLTHPMQAIEQSQIGRTYALTPSQAHVLVQQIQKALAQLESAPTPDGGGLKH